MDAVERHQVLERHAVGARVRWNEEQQHGVVGGHAEIYYDRRASEPYDVTLLLPRAELAVVAHWDAEDVAGAVTGLREVDVSGALARWQLLVDENSTSAYVVRDLDV